MFYRWLVSYVLVLLVPVIVGIVLYAQAGRLVERESRRANELVIAEVGRAIDEVLRDAERLSWQVAEHHRTVSAANLVHPLSGQDYYTFYSLARDFGVYRFANRRISTFYVYLRNLDMIVAPEGVRAADIHFGIAHDVDAYDFADWLGMLNEYHKRRFMTLPATGTREQPSRRVALVHSIPELAVDSPPATLVILLDLELFLGPIQRNYLLRDGFGAILDFDFEPVVATRDFTINPETKARIRSGESFVQQIDGTAYVMNAYTSHAREWTYLTAVPEALFAQRNAVLMRVAVIGLVVVLIVGFFSAWYQTTLRYVPMRHLMAKLAGPEQARPRDEWRFIEEQFAARLRMHDDELRSHTLSQLAHGNIAYTPEVASRLEELGVPADAVNYGLIAIVVEDTGQLAHGLEKDDKDALAHRVVNDVFLEALSKVRRVVAFDLESHPAFIVMAPVGAGPEYAPGSTHPVPKREILTALNTALIKVRERYGLVITVITGDRSGTLGDLPRLHRELREAYEYRLVQGTGGVIVHKIVESPKRSFDYPMEVEQAFMNAVRCGDAARALEALDEVYEANFERQDISVDMAKCLVFDLVSTMVKTLSGITEDQHGAFWDDVRPVRRLLECETAQNIHSVMTDIVESVCTYVNANKKSHNEALRTKIADYLNDNYRDPGLCTAGIALGLGMNAAYLTRFYREQTGYGIAEYLTRYRVDRAKEILIRDGVSVRTAAEQTGFTNANALIRAFKRFLGVTPQQYREISVDIGRDDPSWAANGVADTALSRSS